MQPNITIDIAQSLVIILVEKKLIDEVAGVQVSTILSLVLVVYISMVSMIPYLSELIHM